MVREYELGLLINPDLNDEQLEAQIVRLGQQVESHGGEITRLDRWGRRRLSYSIQRHRDGYYTFMEFRIDSSALRDLERVVAVQENVLRHLLTWRDPRAQAERRRREEAAAQLAQAQAAAQQAQLERQQAMQAQAAAQQAQAQAEAASQPASVPAEAVPTEAVPTEAVPTDTETLADADSAPAATETEAAAPIAGEPTPVE